MPDKDDPFGDLAGGRTIIKPGAGRSPRSGLPGNAPGSPDADGRSMLDGAPLADLPAVEGFNPLLQAATALLRTAPRIRAMSTNADPSGLRIALIEGVRQFERDARSAGLPNEQVVGGQYILCTFLDEAASSTPWGGSGSWQNQSLLVTFHSENWGGEKVFVLLSKLAQDITRHRNILELMVVVLALGFQGRYRVVDGGAAQLESVRDRLTQMLRTDRGAPEKDLSPHWAGVQAAPVRVRDGLPVWVVAAVAAFALMLLFIGLRFAVQDNTFEALQALDVPPAPAVAVVPPAPAAAPRLTGFLQPEIEAGLVEVHDYADRSVVVIRGDGIFDAGSDAVSDRVVPLIRRIADALNMVPGAVLVSGHTDNQRIHTVRFPSNWDLSQKRAGAVRAMLAQSVSDSRIKAEGRADGEPIAPNDTPEGRSKNRRVEITLMSPPAAA